MSQIKSVSGISKPTTKPQAEKQTMKQSLFYISRSLFENKRLKHRLRARLRRWEKFDTKSSKLRKTAKMKNKDLVPNETINLLSEEEQDPLMSNTNPEEESIIITSDSEDGAEHATQQGTQRIFPMLPDETTVQTEIGNRVYHLSLTKLREGLASNKEVTSGKRKRGVDQTVTSAPAPIPINLSNDLSISLISDDEEEITEQQKIQSPPLDSHKHQDVVGQLPKRRKLG